MAEVNDWSVDGLTEVVFLGRVKVFDNCDEAFKRQWSF